MPSAAQQHHVVELLVGDLDLALDHIGEAGARRSAAPCRRTTGETPARSLARVAIAPAAVVAHRQAPCALARRASPPAPRAWPSNGRPCLSASRVCATSACRAGALELEHRRLVGIQPQPAQSVEDRLDRGLRGALPVGVLDAQQIAAAMVTGEQPVEQRGSRTPDVQITSRRRSKPDDYTHG